MQGDAANNGDPLTCLKILTSFIDRTCVGVAKEHLDLLKATLMEACVTKPNDPLVANKLTFLFSQLPPDKLSLVQSYNLQMLKIIQNVLQGKQADEEFDQMMKSISLK